MGITEHVTRIDLSITINSSDFKQCEYRYKMNQDDKDAD